MLSQKIIESTDTGYTNIDTGDSGSPFWVSAKTYGDNEDRAILTAVTANACNLGPLNLPNGMTDDAKVQCRAVATKITEDILAWAKKWAFCDIGDIGEEEKSCFNFCCI